MPQSANTEIVKPDIFIAGAMKCGTTVLHENLCTHPRIQSGSQKEIHYFSLYYDRGPAWYHEHFSAVSEGSRTIDASPTYFDASNTRLIPSLIRAYTEHPRVILITRDPIQRAVSQFVHLQKIVKTELLQDLSADEFFAIDFDDAFRQTTLYGFYLQQVLRFSLYFRKFRTYQQNLEPEQLLVLDNDQLRCSPVDTMKRVFDFVGEDYHHDEVFAIEKYSNGSGVNQISKQTFDRLAELLYPDYRQYCSHAGIEYKEIAHISVDEAA